MIVSLLTMDPMVCTVNNDLSQLLEFQKSFPDTGIFVWVGKKASQQERTEAMRNGQGFAKKKEYPPNTNVTRVLDGGEPAEFRTLFRDWKVRDQSVGFGRQASGFHLDYAKFMTDSK